MLANPVVRFLGDPFQSFGFRPEIINELNDPVRPLSLHKIAAPVLVAARLERWLRVLAIAVLCARGRLSASATALPAAIQKASPGITSRFNTDAR